MNEGSSQKHTLVLVDDEKRTPPKRHKASFAAGSTAVSESSSSPPKQVTPQFQRFHLNVLRSLYDDDGDDDYEDNENVFRDMDGSMADTMQDKVDDLLWVQTKKFLKEREKLIQQKTEASLLKEIHQEALNFLDERDSLVASSPVAAGWNASASSIVPMMAPSDAAFQGLCSSPHSLSFFSSSPQQPRSMVDDDETKSPTKCFGLVATLLEKRFTSFHTSVQTRSNPYDPVLKQIEAKITKLEQTLQKLQEETLSKQKQAVDDLLSRPVLLSSSSLLEPSLRSGKWKTDNNNGDDDAKSALSKLEAKLGLWKMLADDLRGIVQSATYVDSWY